MGSIMVPQPSMALNAWNMTGTWFPQYKMWNSWTLGDDEMVDHIVGWIGEVAKGAPGGRLKCIVINSHGSCGRARLSKPYALDPSTTSKWAPLKGLVRHILITACDVVGVKQGENNKFWNDPGVKLLYGLAQATGARVYASNVDQSMDVSYFVFTKILRGGEGDIDSFEGSVLSIPPNGQAAWLNSNGEVSLYLRNT